jgi:hypothetical protein
MDDPESEGRLDDSQRKAERKVGLPVWVGHPTPVF